MVNFKLQMDLLLATMYNRFFASMKKIWRLVWSLYQIIHAVRVHTQVDRSVTVMDGYKHALMVAASLTRDMA